MKTINVVIFSFILFSFSSLATEINSTEQTNSYCSKSAVPETQEKFSYIPANGYVPNEETAIKIAVAVWEPIYGVRKIAEEKPYKANLQNGVWFVTGSLKSGWVGGVAEIEICKTTAQIIRLSHGK